VRTRRPRSSTSASSAASPILRPVCGSALGDIREFPLGINQIADTPVSHQNTKPRLDRRYRIPFPFRQSDSCDTPVSPRPERLLRTGPPHVTGGLPLRVRDALHSCGHMLNLVQHSDGRVAPPCQITKGGRSGSTRTRDGGAIVTKIGSLRDQYGPGYTFAGSNVRNVCRCASSPAAIEPPITAAPMPMPNRRAEIAATAPPTAAPASTTRPRP